MAQIPNSVPVTALIAPTDSADTYATHSSLYGKGGLRTVDSIAERDAIPAARREISMLVYVIETNSFYRLLDDLEEWENLGALSTDGNGITSIEQPSDLVMRVKTRDLPAVDIVLRAGGQGDKGDKGDRGDRGISDLSFQKVAHQTIEHFEGSAVTGVISNFYTTLTQNGAVITQRSTAKSGFKSATLVDFSVALSAGAAQVILRKAIGATVFAYIFNPAAQSCEMEMKFLLDQLPTSANDFLLDMKMTDTSSAAFESSPNGVQAKIYWDSGLGRAAIALTTKETNPTTQISSETSSFELQAGVVYTMRIIYVRSANLCNLYMATALPNNNAQVASRTLRLPSTFLSPSVRILKVTGSSAVTGTIDYIETLATDL